LSSVMTEPSPAEAIFLAALEKTTDAQRTAFLEQACAGKPDLRRRIERLLAAHARVGAFLERPVAEAADLAGFAVHDTPIGGAASGTTPSPRGPGHREPLPFLAGSQRPGSLGRLGHYEVLEVVGKGTMGIVLRAFDEKLHRVVALKVLSPQLATDPGARERFVREARAAAAVSHDNVVAIYAVEDDGPVPYLVMQYIEGRTLQEQLDRSGPPPVQEIVRLGVQAAAGLAAAHRFGMVHRDVKPANILLEKSTGRVKITDFGLARVVDDAPLTQSGIVAGTPAYMSPEQANGARVDPRSDLFGLGSVLYTLCAGHAPFRGGTALAVLKRICEETPPPLREINPDIPAWLEAVIARLHARNPADRFQTATEVAQQLGRHLAPQERFDSPGELAVALEPFCGGSDLAWQLAVPSPSGAPTASSPGPARSGPRRRRMPGHLVLLTAAAVLLVGVIPGIIILGRGGPDEAGPGPQMPTSFRGSVDVLVLRQNALRQDDLLSLTDPRALPLVPGDRFRIEATVDPPAYIYLFWINSAGKAEPLFPWEEWKEIGQPRAEKAEPRVSLPEQANQGFKFTTPGTGLETLLMLARTTPLTDPGEEVQKWFEALPEGRPLPAENYRAWFEDFRLVKNDPTRRATFERKDLGLPALRLQAALQPRLAGRAELIRAVSFAAVEPSNK
jgi:serine/threonine protein kinase